MQASSIALENKKPFFMVHRTSSGEKRKPYREKESINKWLAISLIRLSHSISDRPIWRVIGVGLKVALGLKEGVERSTLSEFTATERSASFLS